MKKLSIFLLALVLVACTQEDASLYKTDDAVVISVVDDSPSKDIIEPPSVNLDGKEVWEQYNFEEIMYVEDKVFMFSDADKLENKLIEELEKDYNDKSWRGWGNYLITFSTQTNEHYPEYSTYFSKLTETLRAILEQGGDKSAAVNKLKEAKEIRERIEDAK